MKNQIGMLILMGFTFMQFSAIAQTDSLVFKNGKYLVGEIKSMERGTLTIETPFGQSDFEVKWEEIALIYTGLTMIISTTDGQRHYGTMQSMAPDTVTVDSKYEGLVRFPLSEIVYIKPIEKSFLDRLNASLDLGYTRTKAENQRQFTVRSRIGYIAERYSVDLTFNSLDALREGSETISRTDGNVTLIYVPVKYYFGVVRLDYLQNTEQLLDLRSNYKVGLGKFIVRKNSMSWHVMGGLSQNNERFVGLEEDRRGGEVWLGSEVNLFNIGDLSLFSNVFAYTGITKSDRLRLDFRADLKYNLPLDFYIKTGVTLNFDNEPVLGASDTDYIWQTSFGWSW